MSKPKFAHDCDKCKYQGSATYEDRDVDLYLCGDGVEIQRSLIIRFSSEGPDYMSSMLFCTQHLSELDFIALNGELELTPLEKAALFRVLIRERKSRMTLDEYKTLAIMGEGNIWNKN